MDFVTGRLIKWYNLNKRNLPWRDTNDPYRIWLSEVILQQTRVNQGYSYYIKFLEAFPTVSSLASAKEDEVLRLWQGLGYYSRARNIHKTAKIIVSDYNMRFPDTFEGIKSLKGIGDYTASAISSFAFNLPYAVVDGNVYRVLSRIFGIDIPIDSSLGKKYFQQLANSLLPKKNHAIYNQAIMEFGAIYCKPVNPDCNNCIFNDKCLAMAQNRVNELPVKSKKQKIKDRFLHYYVLKHGKNIYIRKRNDRDIWKGLYEFYLVESEFKMSVKKWQESKEHQKIIKLAKVIKIKMSGEYVHILSHQKLHATFYLAEVKSVPVSFKLKKIKINELNRYALPRLIEKYIQDEKFFS